MPKQYHQDVLSDGLNVIKANATKIMLVSSYALGESYATVTGRKLAEAAVASADFTLSNVAGANGSDRQLAFAGGKTGNAVATVAAGQNLHAVVVDATRILAVTDEVTDQAITTNNPVNFPAFNMTLRQPE